jgi:MULE transposase domain
MDSSLGLSRSNTKILLPFIRHFESFNEAVEYMHLHSAEYSYAMTKLRSKHPLQDQLGQQLFRRNWFQCDRHSKLQSISTGIRKTASRGTGCQFQLQIDLQQTGLGQRWVTTPKNEHNHPPSASIASHPVHRVLPSNTKSKILSMSAVGSTPRQIIASIAKYSKNIIITKDDINNIIRTANKEFLNGRTKIQALVDELRANDDWIFKANKDSENRITHLFFALKSQHQLIHAFPDILLMDCTYNTNRYNMPLLHIVGKTPINLYFSCAFCFMAAEGEEDYLWVLSAFKELMWEDLQPPSAVITDDEKSLTRALNLVFPDVPQLLCTWHIQKNILKHIAKSWKRYRVTGDTSEERETAKLHAEEKKSRFPSAWLHVSRTITYYYYILLLHWLIRRRSLVRKR